MQGPDLKVESGNGCESMPLTELWKDSNKPYYCHRHHEAPARGSSMVLQGVTLPDVMTMRFCWLGSSVEGSQSLRVSNQVSTTMEGHTTNSGQSFM